MPPRNLTIILITAVFSFTCYLKAARNRHAVTIARAMNTVTEYYVEDVESRELFENAMQGMMSGLDQYSGYIAPETFQRLEADLDQEFGGVGVEVEKPGTDQPITVISPVIGAPAERAGMRAGDQILAVDGVNMIGTTMQDAVKLMRGKAGTDVLLSVLHRGDEEPVEITVTREVITVDSVLGDTRRADGSWDFRVEEDPRIGYYRVTTFGQYTVEELSKAMAADGTEPLAAIIIDLRGNAGGLLDAAVGTCRLFINDGVIVTTRGRDREVREALLANRSAVVSPNVPTVVLVDTFSASASEIVAACLQDHERAIVIGQRTWGKGTVQNVLPLEGGRSALKLTTATYWRPSDRNIHKREGATDDEEWGVQPEVGFEVVLSDDDAKRVVEERRRRSVYTDQTDADDVEEDSEPADGERFDPQLRRAIEHLEAELARQAARPQAA